MANISSEKRQDLVVRRNSISKALAAINNESEISKFQLQEFRKDLNRVPMSCQNCVQKWEAVLQKSHSQHNKAQPDALQIDVKEMKGSLQRSCHDIDSLISSQQLFESLHAPVEKRLISLARDLQQLCQDWEPLLKDHHTPHTPEAVVQSGQGVEGVGQESWMVKMEEKFGVLTNSDHKQLKELTEGLQTRTDQEQEGEVQVDQNTDDQDRSVDQLLEDMGRKVDRANELVSGVLKREIAFTRLLEIVEIVIKKLKMAE